jgi:D-alanyl-D-alanine dipeptidase
MKMSIHDEEAKKILVDVIALSQHRCKTPIAGQLAYAGIENFVGRVIDGYNPEAFDVILLARQAAEALCQVQNALNTQELGLYIFDAYRPLRAVKDFAIWFRAPVANAYETECQRIHYPQLTKPDLVAQGYIPDTVSRHNFGRAVDLTLIHLHDQSFLDMGACFDFFDELSHHTATVVQLGEKVYQNRQLLLNIMQQHDFQPYPTEYWHYDYHVIEVEEPMDLPIDTSLKHWNV